MKLLVALSTLLAVSLAEDAKVVAAPLPYYAGYPYAGYGYAGLPYAAAPVTYAAAPAVAAPVAPVTYAAPIAPYVGSQFHAQDEFGNLNYGYSNLNSAKQEVGNTYGGVQGGYSYVDAAGVLQQVQYVADGAGFRVADSRLPVAPVFNPEPLVAPTFNPEPLVAPVFNPEPLVAPELTPEVAEATAAHLAAVAAAAAPAAEERKKREADPAVLAGGSRIISAPTPLIHNAPVLPTVAAPLGYHGLGYGYGYGLGYAGYAGHLGYGLY